MTVQFIITGACMYCHIFNLTLTFHCCLYSW